MSLEKTKRHYWRRLFVGVAAGSVGVLSLTGLVSGSASATSNSKSNAPHIMTIMMENTDYSQFVGSPTMPYLNEISHEYANYTQAYGWTYPSLPNYLELLSGSDDGTAGSDCDITDPGCSGFTNPTLVTQLEAAGLTWNGYYQGDASGCDQSDGTGNYPYWHNAFRYFSDFSSQCSHLSNFSDLNSNLNSPNAADFQWVVPDLVNSGGDNGTMASGDSWLSTEVPQIMDSSWYRAGGQIVIIYDTGYNDTSAKPGFEGGQIPMVVVSANTKGMGSIASPISTAGVLRSVESAYGLSYLGDAANAGYGNLGKALIAGRPTGSSASQTAQGAVLNTSLKGPDTVSSSAGNGTLAFNGIAQVPESSSKNHSRANDSTTPSTIAVGENSSGQGIISDGKSTTVVGASSALEAVSCASASECYAVGLAPSNVDEAVLVTIHDGRATSSEALPSFIGLYGIACPTSSTCYAVGYDNSDDADAVTTITNGHASPPVEVEPGQGVGEWLDGISCPTSTQCFAVGLVNYLPAFVPITSGVPGTPVTISLGYAWYVNGIDCTTVDYCVAVGENNVEQGIVSTLVDGSIGTTEVVPSTENVYGAACGATSECVLTGASLPVSDGLSVGTVTPYVNGAPGHTRTLTSTNGFGPIACSQNLQNCVAAGSAYVR